MGEFPFYGEMRGNKSPEAGVWEPRVPRQRVCSEAPGRGAAGDKGTEIIRAAGGCEGTKQRGHRRGTIGSKASGFVPSPAGRIHTGK